MRHRKAGNKLGRTASHRKAMISNMTISLFEHISIKTTLPKAKEVRKTAEHLITFAKRGDLHARRQVLRIIPNKEIVKKLFEEIVPKFADRNGGYTRIVGLGKRQGDGAELAILELVGYEGIQMEKIEKQRAKREEKEKAKIKEKEEAEAQAAMAPPPGEPVEEEEKK